MSFLPKYAALLVFTASANILKLSKNDLDFPKIFFFNCCGYSFVTRIVFVLLDNLLNMKLCVIYWIYLSVQPGVSYRSLCKKLQSISKSKLFHISLTISRGK